MQTISRLQRNSTILKCSKYSIYEEIYGTAMICFFGKVLHTVSFSSAGPDNYCSFEVIMAINNSFTGT